MCSACSYAISSLVRFEVRSLDQKLQSFSLHSHKKLKHDRGKTSPDENGGVLAAIVLPVSITTRHTQDSYIRNLNGNAPVSHESEFPISLVLKSSHLGIPLIPPSRMINIPDEKLFEEGYGSDIQRGPFHEIGVSDEILVVMDEDESVSELVIPPVVATLPSMSREPAQMEKTSTERVIVKELRVDLIVRMHVT